MGRMRGTILFGAKIVISLALLYVAFRFVNFGALRDRLNQLNTIWIAAALVTLGVQIVLVSLRWQRIAESCGAHFESPPRRPLHVYRRILQPGLAVNGRR